MAPAHKTDSGIVEAGIRECGTWVTWADDVVEEWSWKLAKQGPAEQGPRRRQLQQVASCKMLKMGFWIRFGQQGMAPALKIILLIWLAWHSRFGLGLALLLRACPLWAKRDLHEVRHELKDKSETGPCLPD